MTKYNIQQLQGARAIPVKKCPTGGWIDCTDEGPANNFVILY